MSDIILYRLFRDEHAKFNALKSDSDRRISDLIRLMEAKETENTKVLTELENKYEHKIADQMERYGRVPRIECAQSLLINALLFYFVICR